MERTTPQKLNKGIPCQLGQFVRCGCAVDRIANNWDPERKGLSANQQSIVSTTQRNPSYILMIKLCVSGLSNIEMA
nr:hypothetical protein HmN_000504600 [Hymenolepis microstoma]